MSDHHQASLARVAVVIDDATFSRTLVATLLQQLGFEVFVAASGNAGIDVVDRVDPDLAVVDLDLGEGPTGMEIVRHIRDESPWVAVLVLTAYRTPKLVNRHEPIPQDVAYLVKSDIESPETFTQAVEAVLSDRPVEMPGREHPLTITPAQSDVLRLMSEGYSNSEIAHRLDMSPAAVERLIGRLYRALGITSDPARNPRVEAVRLYTSGAIDAVSRRGGPHTLT